MNRSIPLAAAVLAALLAMPSMAAPPEGKGKDRQGPPGHPASAHDHGRDRDRDHHRDHGPLVSVSIGVGDARRIAERHGYVGYQSLPPGIARNLARGKPLPPGIAKKVVPGPMLRDLPVYDGYEWGIYGDDLVLVSIASGVIAEVLADVFR